MRAVASTQEYGDIGMTSNLNWTCVLCIVQTCLSLLQQSQDGWSRRITRVFEQLGRSDESTMSSGGATPMTMSGPSDASSANTSPRAMVYSNTTSPASCHVETRPATALPYPDYVPDEGELERRRLGEAQPQLVPTEVFLNKYFATTRPNAR
ncbi:hypothetical protein JDV02_004213 [Purpureocillium takamizusanense]|uniref:Uncharacterized protein n=1 Tax=Purpureocillium takamizusanense TaxID=2060973 RepID=A0A9Q8QET6_9HYPO|nr:uncharacterized protein JDV02_004213 [Purpureocillium takamizusanense]UNI17906.1 hypothetical protein JDV02_004213 [Purpureocillium takamizusanense]